MGDSLKFQKGVEEFRRGGTWSHWGEGKTPKAKLCYTDSGPLLILTLSRLTKSPLTKPVCTWLVLKGTKLYQGNTVT